MSRQKSKYHQSRRIRWYILSTIYIVSYLSYLIWRLTTINFHYMLFSSAFFMSECLGFVLGLIIIFSSRCSYERKISKPPKDCTVDVFITVYKEPVELVRHTIMAAKNIEYPHQTWVLDDGQSEELCQLAKELGVCYISRHNNAHAKAGNINFGLTHSRAEFFMVLDADHIPLPHALDITLGFFSNKNVALVQTPQDYYNTDSFQYFGSKQRNLWHDQLFFYQIAQCCADSINGATCVGTGVIYRRSAIDAIGGIPDTTLTEDIHTSLKLHKSGCQTVYLNEPIAYGIASSDLNEYYKTRHRWAHGNLQALREENILFCKGLSVKQRINYLTFGLIYLEGWQKLILMLVPILSLFFGWQPFVISIFNVMIILFFPFFCYAILRKVSFGLERFWANEVVSMARWPVHLVAVAGLFRLPLSWKSSFKRARSHARWDLMMPQIIIMIASIAAIIFALFKLTDFQLGALGQGVQYFSQSSSIASNIDIFSPLPKKGYSFELIAIAGVWALYNTLLVILFIVKAIKATHRKSKFTRVWLPFPVLIDQALSGCVHGLSEDWLYMTILDSTRTYQLGQRLKVGVFLPSGCLTLHITIANIIKNNKNSMTIEGSIMENVNNHPSSDKDAIAKTLYSVNWYGKLLCRDDFLAMQYGFTNHFLPVLFDNENESNHDVHYGLLLFNKQHKDYTLLIAFISLKSGAVLKGTKFYKNKGIKIKFMIDKNTNIFSPLKKNLDGTITQCYQIKNIS